jgi:hypothetical protein
MKSLRLSIVILMCCISLKPIDAQAFGFVKTLYVFVQFHADTHSNESPGYSYDALNMNEFFNHGSYKYLTYILSDSLDRTYYSILDLSFERSSPEKAIIKINGISSDGIAFRETTSYHEKKHKKFYFAKDIISENGHKIATVIISSAQMWKKKGRDLAVKNSSSMVPKYISAISPIEALVESCKKEFDRRISLQKNSPHFSCVKYL